MYLPAHFAETRPEVLAGIIRAHPLGMLVTYGAEGLDAAHIPFEFDPGAGTDGVSIDVDVTVLNQVDAAGFTWQVPGLRHELP